MSLLTEAWIAAGRLRRKLGKPTVEEWVAGKQRWISEHAPGRSFADIGGLLIDGATSFEAEAAGASAVTLFDVGDCEYAPGYEAEHRRRGSKVRYVQGDLHDPVALDQIGPHDLVWCTGVLYHSPHPLHQLMQLREITRELLFLGTHTIPEVPGVPQACLFYPHQSAATRRTLARAHHRADGYLGVGPPIDERPMFGYANFWWGITPSALRAMLATARFEVVEERRIHPSPWQTELVARPVDADPLLPPVGYFRERREARERGEELPWEDYYERVPWRGRLGRG
jgi:hypothetical protein